jgi:CheY-like chemotaxis protein
MDILLVEDNATDAELLTEAFRDACTHMPSITIATDGEAALKTLRGMPKKPKLVLLDLNMPKVGGLEVLKEIRQDADPDINLIPVVILTNSKHPQDVQKAYECRCNAFVRKPVGFPKLLRLARKLHYLWLQFTLLPHRSTPPPYTPS